MKLSNSAGPSRDHEQAASSEAIAGERPLSTAQRSPRSPRRRRAWAGKKQPHFRELSDESDQDKGARRATAKRVKTKGSYVGLNPKELRDA